MTTDSLTLQTFCGYPLSQDPTNLQTKLQKHQNFETEVDANKNRIENIRTTGQQLIDKDHYAKGPIKYEIFVLYNFIFFCFMIYFL